MYEADFYTKVKEILLEEIKEIKHIAPWNNQVDRMEENNSFGLPAVFIEFNPVSVMQFQRGIQQIEYNVTVHVVIEGYLEEDLRIFDIRRRIYRVFAGLTLMNWSTLENIGNRPNFDHDNVQEYVMEFRTLLTDFSDYNGPDRPVLMTPEFTVSY